MTKHAPDHAANYEPRPPDTVEISSAARLMAAISEMKQRDLERIAGVCKGATSAFYGRAASDHNGFARACDAIIELIRKGTDNDRL